MKFIQRLGYYLGGFSIGLIILFFFLNGKKVSCDYGPDARVLKNISGKKIIYPSNNDSTIVNYILKHGEINFSESTPRQEPCAIYLVEGRHNDNSVNFTVENCDSIATILNLKINK
ncbi:hypothetical protein [Seonamhaeicola sp. ML3]|uniref:hypothetical protein n=1 Tax=Seonamhaeicola sp. ML3 TaxID=2937786 RepID=UPI00200EC9D1|nr:hypothetical protein [Seonamhaeicola sp. ML3]